jgi:hypothetical protein
MASQKSPNLAQTVEHFCALRESFLGVAMLLRQRRAFWLRAGVQGKQTAHFDHNQISKNGGLEGDRFR